MHQLRLKEETEEEQVPDDAAEVTTEEVDDVPEEVVDTTELSQNLIRRLLASVE
jgi:hypothetical protein